MPINKISNVQKIEKRKTGQELFEVIIKNELGEVIYQNTSEFGLLYSSEKIMQVDLEVRDRHQVFGWGSAYMWPHAIMMFRQEFKKGKVAFFESVDALDIPQDQKNFIKINFEKLT